jgi:methylase of polypeptide subunit release factors
MFSVARRELHRAPITRNHLPTRILDLGTGTGIWAIDMADQYPEAEVDSDINQDTIRARSNNCGLGYWYRSFSNTTKMVSRIPPELSEC